MRSTSGGGSITFEIVGVQAGSRTQPSPAAAPRTTRPLSTAQPPTPRPVTPPPSVAASATLAPARTPVPTLLPNTLALTQPLAISAPSGLFTGAPLTFTFGLKNPTSAEIEAKLITVQIRGPAGQGLGLTCAGGSNVRIAPGAEFACRTFSFVGTYGYWVDWLWGTDTWHNPDQVQGQLGPWQQFNLAAP